MATLEQIDTAERIVRLETKLDFLIAQLSNLPPSPTCVSHHIETNKRLTSLEAWRNKAIGVLIAVNILVAIIIEKFINFIGIK